MTSRSELYPVCKLLGMLLFGYLVWLIQFLFQLNFSIHLYVGALALLINNLWKKKQIEKFWHYEVFSLLIFIIFLVICSFKPELLWGEKPMDISMMNYLYRQNGVIGEPWYSGATLKYYYFGYYIFAKYLTIFKMHPLIGYHVCLSLVASFFFSISTSLFARVNNKGSFSLFAAMFLLFSSSTQTLFNIFIKKQFDWIFFWENTRIFKDKLFAEFPLWSFSFADFHPHVIAYPFFLLMIWLILDLQQHKGESFNRFFILTFVGINLAVINSWDVFFLAPLSVLLVFSLYWKDIFHDKKVHIILYPVLSSLLCLVLYLPLLKGMSGATSGSILSIFRGNHNSILNLLKHQGAQLILLFLILTINVDLKKAFDKKTMYKTLSVIIASILTISIFKIPISYSISIVLIILFILLNCQKNFEGIRELKPWFLTLILMYFVSEHVIIFDRINSLFKINNATYILSSILVLFLINNVLNNKIIKNISFGILSIFVGISIFNLIGITSYGRYKNKKLSLNVKAQLERVAPGDNSLVGFINDNISGNPVIVEAFGKAYDYQAGRIQWFTGLTGFLVWSGQHLTQRGVSHANLIIKEKVINSIYNSSTIKEAYKICITNLIDYVVIGRLERKRYPNGQLNKFSNNSDMFEKIFEDKKMKTFLFKVKR
ncbi:MAG: hypothetical protein HN576_05045 [Bacteriovoracaceae bacterium]|nr:hypothetical protein [Bacteriovoracaceae bacterium]